MTEEEARDYVRGLFGVSRETTCIRFADLVVDENSRQNLISKTTLSQLWDRHIVDSAQIIQYAPRTTTNWCDIGSGAGFPGMVIAALTDYNVTMIEPRRRRASFLAAAADVLGFSNVAVIQRSAESMTLRPPADVISARAVAPLSTIFTIAHRLATISTTWILPKGRSADREIADAREHWRGTFHVEQSITDADASIVVATGVCRR